MSGGTVQHTISGSAAFACRTLVVGLALYGGLDLVHGAMAQDEASLYLPAVAKAEEVQSLESRVAALESLLANVSREGNDIYLTGANLHVVNGTGVTTTTNGLGNVMIGYNEVRADPLDHNERSGSHMLIVGLGLNYSRFGGIVAGTGNEASGDFASAIGGKDNRAIGAMSAVLGGEGNEASGEMDVASGGVSNRASGGRSVSVGGQANWAEGFLSAAMGGDSNNAPAWASSVLGGRENVASGAYAVASGGRGNTASGDDSSVSGGYVNEASGPYASVSGGRQREATDDYNWRAGDLLQPY
jgi:hypothetical protein